MGEGKGATYISQIPVFVLSPLINNYARDISGHEPWNSHTNFGSDLSTIILERGTMDENIGEGKGLLIFHKLPPLYYLR